MNFDIAIPTYKRPEDLAKCLDSIRGQEVLPGRVFIVDDDELPAEFIDKYRKLLGEGGVELVHYRKDHAREPRGSNESRNKGLELARADVLFIFDDDVVLREGFLGEIMELWEKYGDDKDLIGVSGIAENYRRKGVGERIYNKLFGLSSGLSWDVNRAGFQVWDTAIKQVERGYYMSGYCCSYRVEPAKGLGFTTFLGGRGGLVDPDFSLRAKSQGYYFLVNPRAKVLHNQSPVSRERAFDTGYKEGYNRKVIFYNNCPQTRFNKLHFVWANIGWILRQFLVGNFQKGAGMIKGLFTPVN